MCGIVGMFGPDMPLEVISNQMPVLNYRGEQNAGIVLVKENGEVFYEKSQPFGPVSALSTLFMKTFSHYQPEDCFRAALGHLRYSTEGSPSIQNAQPLYAKIGEYEIWLGHNGDTPNFEEMNQDLKEQGRIFTTSADSEFILQYIGLANKDDILDSIKLGLRDYTGTYSLLMLVKRGDEVKLIAARDPSGNRPLALGKLGNGWILASENVAFESVKGEFIREINPGEMLIISEKGLESRQLLDSGVKKLHHCVFENIYFSHPSSIIFNLPVAEFRENLGKIAAQRHGHLIKENDLVAYVPDSSKYFAIGFCKILKRPMDEIFVRHHTGVIRSFTQADQDSRITAITKKLSLIGRMVEGKRVWILEDSMVTGNTARKIIRCLKINGAIWVGFIPSAPPIMGPCEKGVNHDSKHLIAPKYLIDKAPNFESIRKEIEADFLAYLTIEDLENAIKEFKGNPNNFCYGCFEGQEPIWEVW